MKKQKRQILFPAWLYLILAALLHEALLHLFTVEEFMFPRFLAVILFALGLGAILGLLVSLIPSPRWAKAVTIILSLTMTVFWMVEYYVNDAYGGFMSLETILGGAGGVATGFLPVVLGLVQTQWPIMLLALLPSLLYVFFCRTAPVKWTVRGILAGSAAAAYLLGAAVVSNLTGDAMYRFRSSEFGMQVRSFGLHGGLVLHSLGPEQTFVRVDPLPEPTAAATSPASEEEGPAQTEPPVVYGDNVIPGLDLAALAQDPKNAFAKSVYEYAATLTPTKKNAYTGMFAGKNLILITAEAFSKEVIDPERTPTLYRMATKGIRFQEYYQPAWGASTTSGEFSNLIGLVPTNGGACMKETLQQKFVFTMGHQLQRLGYTSIAYHNHALDFYDRNLTHTHLGYDKFLALYGGLEGVTIEWPESDREMIDATVPQYIDQQPFSIYYMTVSGHCPYSPHENVQTLHHIDEFQDMNHSDTVKGYYASQQELELAMASLVKQLEEAGIADDTVVVIASDHYPYGLERSKTWQNTRDHLAELYGVENYDNFLRDHNALIIWSGCLEDQSIVVEEPVYSLDILPTLSNLFGVEYDSRLLVGRDILSDAQPLVLWPDNSWITDKGRFDKSTNTFTPSGDAEVDPEYIQRINTIVANKITYSRSVIERNFFQFLSEDIGR